MDRMPLSAVAARLWNELEAADRHQDDWPHRWPAAPEELATAAGWAEPPPNLCRSIRELVDAGLVILEGGQLQRRCLALLPVTIQSVTCDGDVVVRPVAGHGPYLPVQVVTPECIVPVDGDQFRGVGLSVAEGGLDAAFDAGFETQVLAAS